MYIHPSHRAEAATAFKIVSLLAGLLLLICLIPPLPGITNISGYLALHTLMEVIAICVATMIFAIGWNTSHQRHSDNILILSCIFLGVAILDFSHAMSFHGMPDYITASDPEKAINFWLAARTFAIVSLLIIIFRPWHHPSRINRYVILTTVLLITAILHAVLLFHQDMLPATFSADSGLTSFKVGYEYGLIALYLLMAAIHLRQMTMPRSFNSSGLFAASVIFAMSEFFLTRYADVSDYYNLFGHLYKIVAYIFLYRALFVETVQFPFLQLEATKQQLQATIDTLPDLLFRMKLDGEFLDVHADAGNQLTFSTGDLIGRNISAVMSPKNAAIVSRALREAAATGIARGYRLELEGSDGNRHWLELSVARMPNGETKEAPDLLILARDITANVVNETTLKREADVHAALLSLQNAAETRDEKSFLQYGVETAESITDSRISFMHFISEDQETIEMAAWSQRTLDSNHLAMPETHYPISKAGIWADAVRLRKPVILNDYASALGKHGCPDGHSQVIRMLSLPVIVDGLVRLIIGVGNKETDYTEQDVARLQIIAEAIWRIANKRRTDERLRLLTMAVEQSPNAVVITNLNAEIEYVNPAFTASSGYTLQEVLGKNPRLLKSGKTPKGTYVEMWNNLTQGKAWRGELINRSKQGKEYIDRSVIYPVRDEAGQVTHYLSHKENITAQKQIEQRINQLMLFDSLTGLPNRNSLLHMLRRAIGFAKLQNQPLTVMWFNVDHFKQINDTLGHDAGDLVLQEVTIRLSAILRESDYMARVSGDHFVLVAPGTDQNGASMLALQMLATLDRPMQIDGRELNFTLSIGIALYPTDGESISDLLKHSENAMYRMKREGRNGYRFFTSDLQRDSARILALGSALKHAVSRNELRLVYQPQLDLRQNRIIGAEALIRWAHPEFGDIPPSEFIPIAESYGLILDIGTWSIRTALQQIKSWQDSGLAGITVAVNLSAMQFEQPDLAEVIMQMVEEAGVEPGVLELELTEAVAMRDSENAARVIEQLHAKGFTLSIDDFGTGYSSLSYLKRFRIDKLKIDQSFVRDLSQDEDDQTIVDAIIHISGSLGYTTIAEGVESREQLEILQQKGCNQIQGYYVSRPLAPEAFEVFVSSFGMTG
ncbi:MAG TPA: EAL domain-containing protein [Methylophilaceae bacterium]|jgi:diguanylate cyclase (GGDEF)-like protein/PAS domain S-box-containing protein